MLFLPDHFQTSWPGFRSWELAQDLSHRQLNSSIKPDSCCAKRVMGLSGSCCSLSEQCKSVLCFQTGALRETWVSEPIEVPKLQGLHLCPSKAKSSPELRKLSPFSVPMTLLAWIHFFFSNNKSNCWVGKFPLSFPSLERYLCSCWVFGNAHVQVDGQNMQVIPLATSHMANLPQAHLVLGMPWWMPLCTSTQSPRAGRAAWCYSSPRIAVCMLFGTSVHHLWGKLLSLPASCCPSLYCCIWFCVVTTQNQSGKLPGIEAVNFSSLQRGTEMLCRRSCWPIGGQSWKQTTSQVHPQHSGRTTTTTSSAAWALSAFLPVKFYLNPYQWQHQHLGNVHS